MSNILVLIGPPGVGKGTIVEKITWYFPFTFSKALDHVCERNDHIDRQVKIFRREGRLVPHDLVELAFNQYLHEVVPFRADIVFDGFPRDSSQVDVLFKTFSGYSYNMTFVILEAPDDVLLKRITGRKNQTLLSQESGEVVMMREDDSQDIAVSRIKKYRELLPAILDRIRTHKRDWDGDIHMVNATFPQSEVLENIIEATRDQLRLR